MVLFIKILLKTNWRIYVCERFGRIRQQIARFKSGNLRGGK